MVQDPRVNGPAVIKRRHQSSGINDREFIHVRDPHGSPVAVREIDLGQRKGARDERVIRGIKLALDPERPDPVQVMLDGLAVHQSSGVQDHPLTQKLFGG